MAHIVGRKLGTELCEIFGLDPNHVASILIEATPNDAAVIVVRRFVTTDELAELKRTLTRYELIPRTVVDLREEGTDGR